MALLVLMASIGVIYVTDRLSSVHIENRVNSLAKSGGSQIEELLWQYDETAITQLLTNFIASGVLKGAQVSDGFDLNIEAGDVGVDDKSLIVTIPLLREVDGAATILGSFMLVASTQAAKTFARINAIGLIVVSSVTIFLTTLAIFVLLNRRVMQPMLKIERSMVRLTGDPRAADIDISSQTTREMTRELGAMVAAIRNMRESLVQSQSQVLETQKRLKHAAEIARLGYGTISMPLMKFTQCDANLAAMLEFDVPELLELALLGGPDSFQVIGQTTEMQNARRLSFQKGESVTDIFKVKLRNGDLRDYRVILEPLGEWGAADFELNVVMLDVTELRRSEDRAHQAEKLQTVGKLTGGVAHDFNNILAIISGNLELIQVLCTGDEITVMTDAALDAVGRSARVTQQLLAFARKQPLSPVPLDPSQLVLDLKPMLAISVGANIDLDVVTQETQWLTEVDPTQLEASILNLVVNARDAMPDGGKLTVAVANTEIDQDDAHAEITEGQYVCISVTDNGTGMSPETAAKVFEPFFTTKAVGKGTGLGLSMVFGFTKQSGGYAKVLSEESVGTIIRLYLPRVSNATPAPQATDQRHKLTDQDAGRRIVLIEDEEALLALYSAQLKTLGYIVDCAQSGADALALVGEIPVPDLILTDVILPGKMNGKQAADALSAHYPSARVVYMSGYTENTVFRDGQLDAGTLMLQKPFTLANLATTLRSVLAS
tara:strand:- start:1881 stop:4034 length:2154 start_codon:yes stop_codon:yes gene_type:complete